MQRAVVARNCSVIIILENTNPHVIVQPVHVRRAFHRMQSNGTMNFFFLEASGERLGPAAVVVENRLHLRQCHECNGYSETP